MSTQDNRLTSTASSWWHELRKVRQEQWGDPWGYIFITPAILMFLIFAGWPIIRGLSMAFTDYRFLIPDHAPFVGFDNFIKLWNDPQFWETLQRSLAFSVYYLPSIILIPLIVATLVSKVRSDREASFYRVILYLPVILPISVALLFWTFMLNGQFGIINGYLRLIGIEYPPSWLADPAYTIPVMSVASVWKGFGGNMLLFLIGLYNIPRDLYESASIDGASALQQWIHITIPLLRPILTIVLVLSLHVVHGTEQSLIMFQGTGPQNAAQTLGVYAYNLAFRHGDMVWGYAASINLVLGVVSMLIAGLVFRAMRSGERIY